MNTKLFIILLLILSNQIFGQELESLLGKNAPKIAFEEILNFDKEKAKLSDYKGKILLLDFWATWCSPCIKSFPHLESLQADFPDDLQVFTITGDNRSRIEKFLNKFNTSLPIVIDTNYSISKHFPHRTIPHTVVIDKNGRIKVVTTPEKITPQTIQLIIDEQPVEIKEKKENIIFSLESDHLPDDNVMFQITITGYQEGLDSRRHGPIKERLIFTNVALKQLYEGVREFPYTRTVFDVSNEENYNGWDQENSFAIKENLFCLEIRAPGKTKSEIYQMTLDYLHKNFELKSKIERLKQQVKVLKRTTDSLLLKEVDPNTEREGSMSGRGIYLSNATSTALATFIERFVFRKPVIDETGLTNNYHIEIPYHVESPDNFYEDLKKLGFELVDAEREIDMLILYEEPLPTKK